MLNRKNIILYDGDCNFCNKWIRFTKREFKNKEITFHRLKSIESIDILNNYEIIDQDSVVYIHDNIVSVKSKAVLAICKQLKTPYNLFHHLSIVPDFILDFCYDFIAKRRFNINSNKKCCNGK